MSSLFDELSFFISFSISGVVWEIKCSVHQEVRKYPEMNYKAVDVFSIDHARCPSTGTELDGDQWRDTLDAFELKDDFYKAVTRHLMLLSMAMFMKPGEA